MKKSILNLGKSLNKTSQKEIFGGKPEGWIPNYCNLDCYPFYLSLTNNNGDVCHAVHRNTACGQGIITNGTCCV